MALGCTSTAVYSTNDNIGQRNVAENLGKSLSGAQRTAHGKDFELILMIKVETRIP